MEELKSQLWLAGLALALAVFVFQTFPQRAEIERIYAQLDRIEARLISLQGLKEAKPEPAHKPNEPDQDTEYVRNDEDHHKR